MLDREQTPCTSAARSRASIDRRSRVVAFLAFGLLAQAASAAGIEGRWITFDDDTGRPRSVVEITAEGTHFAGRIVSVMPAPGEDADPRCTACTGSRANQPIVGMTVLDVTPTADVTKFRGTAFDPEEGAEYRCTVTLDPTGRALTLRGYVGLPLFGRSMTWRRSS